MAKTKFFRVAVEGATATDGRKIERQMLLDSAATFNRATYGPRINMEHIRGLSADGPFRAFGDVTAVRTQEDEIELDGKTEKRLALYAQLDPTDDLIAFNKQRQKIFTSCEFAANFGGTGKYGLVGLGVTDSPASLGTEALSFTAFKPLWDGRKLAKENLFSAAEPASLELVDEADGAVDSEASTLLKGISAFFTSFGQGKGETPPAAPPPPPSPSEPPANDNLSMQFGSQIGKLADVVGKISTSVDRLNDRMARSESAQAEIARSIETTEKPGQFSRSSATGGTGVQLTDC